MRDPARILVVDDNEANVDILSARLTAQGYEIVTARDGEQALAAARSELPDLILLDIMMPKIDGLQVCRELKADDTLPFIPIVLVTAKAEVRDVVAGLDAGGDDYLTKPVDHAALVARVRSMLRIKALHDTVESQAGELAEWNARLEARVAEQLDEIQRTNRLKRFLSPQIAELVMDAGEEALLDSHRREVTVVFCDLRGFTAFAEVSEPEDVMSVLSDYHEAVGELVHEFEGTVERFAGDGIMVLFNDPLPCPDHAERSVRMSLALRERIGAHVEDWRRKGHMLGLGVGIARGYATLGRIGFEGRYDYAAIGTVVNLASRLCDVAGDGQILVSEPIHAAMTDMLEAEPLGELSLKGLHNPVPAYNVVAMRS